MRRLSENILCAVCGNRNQIFYSPSKKRARGHSRVHPAGGARAPRRVPASLTRFRPSLIHKSRDLRKQTLVMEKTRQFIAMQNKTDNHWMPVWEK